MRHYLHEVSAAERTTTSNLVSFHKFLHLVEYNEVGNKSLFCFFIAKTHTFESICGSRSKVLVRVKFQGQLPVGLLQIFIAGTFVHTKNLIKVLTILYPTKGGKNWNAYQISPGFL